MKIEKRRLGRPTLPEDQLKQNVIALRLTREERQEYEKKAEEKGMFLSEWIRQALRHAVRGS